MTPDVSDVDHELTITPHLPPLFIVPSLFLPCSDSLTLLILVPHATVLLGAPSEITYVDCWVPPPCPPLSQPTPWAPDSKQAERNERRSFPPNRAKCSERSPSHPVELRGMTLPYFVWGCKRTFGGRASFPPPPNPCKTSATPPPGGNLGTQYASATTPPNFVRRPRTRAHLPSCRTPSPKNPCELRAAPPSRWS